MTASATFTRPRFTPVLADTFGGDGGCPFPGCPGPDEEPGHVAPEDPRRHQAPRHHELEVMHPPWPPAGHHAAARRRSPPPASTGPRPPPDPRASPREAGAPSGTCTSP